MKRNKEDIVAYRTGFSMPLVFTALDVARAFGKGMSWAWKFLNVMEEKGLVTTARPGKYKFCWRKK